MISSKTELLCDLQGPEFNSHKFQPGAMATSTALPCGSFLEPKYLRHEEFPLRNVGRIAFSPAVRILASHWHLQSRWRLQQRQLHWLLQPRCSERLYMRRIAGRRGASAEARPRNVRVGGEKSGHNGSCAFPKLHPSPLDVGRRYGTPRPW